MNLLLTLLQIYAVRYAFGLEISMIQCKEPKSTCGVKTGGPMVQQLTKPMFSVPTGFFWIDPELVFVNPIGPYCAHYRPYEDGTTVSALIHELSTSGLHSMIPILDEKRGYLLATDKCLYDAKFKGENADITYTLNKIMDIYNDSTPWAIHRARASVSNKLWLGANIYSSPQSELSLVDIPKRNTKTVSSKNDLIKAFDWNKNSTCMFILENDCVYRYKYNPTTDLASDRKRIFNFKDFDHMIQGNLSCMLVDADGNLWMCVSGAGMIINYDIKKNQITQMIAIPATFITTMTFGGHGLDHIIVGTGNKDVHPKLNEVGAGALYVVSGTGCKGIQGHFVKI